LPNHPRGVIGDLFADKLFGPPAAFASESDEIRLGFPELTPSQHHEGAAMQAGRILAGIQRIEQEFLVARHSASLFPPQIISLVESLPGSVNRILNARHVSSFSGEDMNRPVRVKNAIHVVRYLDVGHILATGEAADLLESDPL
jgi:hypothetical protein